MKTHIAFKITFLLSSILCDKPGEYVKIIKNISICFLGFRKKASFVKNSLS